MVKVSLHWRFVQILGVNVLHRKRDFHLHDLFQVYSHEGNWPKIIFLFFKFFFHRYSKCIMNNMVTVEIKNIWGNHREGYSIQCVVALSFVVRIEHEFSTLQRLWEGCHHTLLGTSKNGSLLRILPLKELQKLENLQILGSTSPAFHVWSFFFLSFKKTYAKSYATFMVR